MIINLKKALKLISCGEVAALPTETVYGLAASLNAEEGIKKIFTLKSRPQGNPLIVHVSSMAQALSLVQELPPHFEELGAKFWPGALTLVAPAKESVSLLARAGLPTVAIRMPNHPLTLEIIRETGPIVAPSANLSGRPSSTSPKHVLEDFGDDFPVLDGGKCSIGIESTILIWNSCRWEIGRLGSIAPESIASCLPFEPALSKSNKTKCPGSLYRHYSPKAKLIYGQKPYRGDSPVVLGFEGRRYPQAEKIFILGDLKKPETVMNNLYKVLRKLDTEGIKEAWVDADFSPTGILSTLAERLEKASRS